MDSKEFGVIVILYAEISATEMFGAENSDGGADHEYRFPFTSFPA